MADGADLRAAPLACTVEVSTDLDAAAPAWSDLETNGACTAFQARAWLKPWFEILGAAHGATPVLVTVRDAKSRRPLMFLPLCLRVAGGARRIEFADLGVSDYNAPLLAKDFAPSQAAFAALWADIVRALPSADLIVLEKQPDMVAGQANPLVSLPGVETMRVRAWDLPLPATREDYDKALDKVVRKELKRKHKNLEMEGPVALIDATTEAEAREIFETHLRQRQVRGTPLGDETPLGQAYVKFYDAAFVANSTSGFSLLSKLLVGGELGATLMALHHRDHHLLIMHCFETGRWGKKSPGIVAVNAAITQQIAAGTRLFDFTIGNETYKLQFGVIEHMLRGYEQGLSVLGRTQIALRRARRTIGTLVRKLPKKYWPKRLRE
ncbi:MAG TPA: GNAT family N-acetyltransferase [Vitreimonas sp.]|nr:GNAT family N-acetyltransferase [Vitreimonas sp.]